MSNPANGSQSENPTVDKPSNLPVTADTIERYETDEGTVIFDASNPLAWIYSDTTDELSKRR